MSSQRNRNRGAGNRGTQQSASQESSIWQRARDDIQTIVQLVNAANDTGREVVEQDKLMTSDSSKDPTAEERKQDDLLRKGVKDIESLNSTLAQTIERLEIYRALKEEQERNAMPVPGSVRSSRDTQGTGRTTGRAGTREQRERERHADSERQRAASEREREKEQKEREKEKELKEQKEQKEQKELKELKEQRERDKEQRERDKDKDRESQRAEREREREKDRDKDREARDRDRGRDRERERERDRDRSTRDRDRSDRDRDRDRDRVERADRADRDRGDRSDRADRADRADRERERERDKDSREKERGDRSERAERSEREKDPYEFDGPGDEMDIEPTTAVSGTSTGTGRKGGAGSSSNSSGNRDSVPPRGGDRDTPVKADSVEPQPSVANAGSSMSSAAQRSRVMFVKGQDVVFKPKPANASDSAEWFLGKVQQVLGEGKSRRYKVKDEDPDVAPELRQEYRTSASSMIPLPPAGQELSELETGKTVLALYPDSTTFYKAEVMSTNKSLNKVNLRFEGEENSGTLQEVERRFVVEYRN